MGTRGNSGPTLLLLLVGGIVALAGACQTRSAHAPEQARTSTAAQAVSANRDRGQQAYLAYCAMCHGVWGEGDGPLSAELKKQAGVTPAQLNNIVRLDELGREEIVRVITLGGGRTHRSNLMPPWGDRLQPAVIGEIADFVMALPSLKPGIPRATIEHYLESTPGSPSEGRKLFVFYCTICHGPYGKGNGLLADTLWARYKIRPRNLTDSLYFAKKIDRELFVTVALGGRYTGHSDYMPGWAMNFTPDEIRHLVSYVRTISRTAPHP